MSYIYSRPVTVDHTKVPNTDQSNFPVPVYGTLASLATVANGGKATNASGFDIAFFSDILLTIPLKYETVAYNAATGAVVYVVKVPTVSHTVDTTIYLAYGNSATSTDQSDKVNTYDANAKRTFNMADNAATTTVLDSTGTLNATANANTSTLTAAAQIGNGFAFDGSTVGLTLGSNDDIVTENGALSFSCLLKPTVATGSQILLGRGSSTTVEIEFYLAANYQPRMIGRGATGLLRFANTNSLTASAWQHLAWTWDGSTTAANVHIYVNGVEVGYATTTNGATLADNVGTTAYIGRQFDGTTLFTGGMQFARIANTVRSADWVKTESNSLLGTFATIGAETGAFPSAIHHPVAMFRGALW